jgi:adenylate cyclase
VQALNKYGARWAAGLLLTALALLHVAGQLRIDPVSRMDTFLADLRMRLQKPAPDPRIVIVDID